MMLLFLRHIWILGSQPKKKLPKEVLESKDHNFGVNCLEDGLPRLDPIGRISPIYKPKKRPIWKGNNPILGGLTNHGC